VGETGRRRAELDRRYAGGLLFPEHAGCAGFLHRSNATPGLCMTRPAMTVAHRYEHPRPQTVRLFVCEAHAVGHPDPRALTDNDRAELRRRRAALSRRGARVARREHGQEHGQGRGEPGP
jgi:hypothetical protein